MKWGRKTHRRDMLAYTLAFPSLSIAAAAQVFSQGLGGTNEATRRQHATLLDQLACRTLMETYWFAEIVHDPDLFASVWTEDGMFGSTRGRANIHARAVESMKRMKETTDLRCSLAGWRVDVNGDTARGQFFLLAHLKERQADGTFKLKINDAHYTNEFVRTPDGWRMSKLSGTKNPKGAYDSTIKAEFPYKG